MRSIFLSLSILVLSISLGSHCWATPVTAPEKMETAPSLPNTFSSTKPIAITPHRAIYDMSLTSVKNGSNISTVSGRMLFEWADVCDGWAVQQHLRLHFNYAEGDESDVTSTELTWESKDGTAYNFNVRRLTNGKETEVYRGKASLSAKGGTVTYSEPVGKTTKLPPGTLFPSAHTMLILQKANAGDKFFSRRVFDGSDEVGSDDVSAFIYPQDIKWQSADMGSKLRNNPLLSQPSWPVRMAFFKLDSETGEPDYEMNLNLLNNGIARTMQIDYGDFTVSGKLINIEAMPHSGC